MDMKMVAAKVDKKVEWWVALLAVLTVEKWAQRTVEY